MIGTHIEHDFFLFLRGIVAAMAGIIAASALASCKPKPVEFGQQAHPFGAVAGLGLGMTRAEAVRRVPALGSSADRGSSMGMAAEQASYKVDFGNEKIEQLQISLHKCPWSELTTAWGPGTK